VTTRYPRWFIVAPIVALLFAGVAAVAFSLGASSREPAARADRPATITGRPELGTGWYGPGTLRGAPGQVAITIAGIDGSKLSLQATDGWTRTIDATGATVSKGGQTITLADLKVGDRITFLETRLSDGTNKITAIQVLAPMANQPGQGGGPGPGGGGVRPGDGGMWPGGGYGPGGGGGMRPGGGRGPAVPMPSAAPSAPSS